MQEVNEGEGEGEGEGRERYGWCEKRDRCGADQPLEEEGGDGSIELRPPVGIREEGAEPWGDCREALRGFGRKVACQLVEETTWKVSDSAG